MFWAGKSKKYYEDCHIVPKFEHKFSKGKPCGWEMFLNEMRHDFSELFYFSVICSPCSRKFEKKANINSERVSTEVQFIHFCSESIVNDVQLTCTNQQVLVFRFFIFKEVFKSSSNLRLTLGPSIPRWSMSWSWSLTLSTNSRKCSKSVFAGPWSNMMVP